MKKLSNKTIGTALILGAVAYYVYSRKKANKSLNPFSKSSNFVSFAQGNPTGTPVKGCQVYAGNVSVPISTRLANVDAIVKTGGGSTVVCPPNQSGQLGAKRV